MAILTRHELNGDTIISIITPFQVSGGYAVSLQTIRTAAQRFISWALDILL